MRKLTNLRQQRLRKRISNMAQRLVGTVSSAASEKTITVQIDSRVTHPVYKKQYTDTTKFKAHDENSEAKIGDTVEIEATRPISKTKTWKLVKVIERAKVLGEIK